MRLALLVVLVAPAVLAQPPLDALLGYDHGLRFEDAGVEDFSPAPFALDAEGTDWSFGQLASNQPPELLCQRAGDLSPRSSGFGSLGAQLGVGVALGGSDGATAYQLVVATSSAPPVLEFSRARCGDAQRTDLGSVTAGAGSALGDLDPNFLQRQVGRAGPGGRVCFVFRERTGDDVLGCFTPDASSLGGERWLTAAALEAALAPAGGFAAASPELVDYVRAGFSVNAAVFVPDGRVFALVTLTWGHRTLPGNTWARQWLVTQASAGAPVLARTRGHEVSQFSGPRLPVREDFESPAFRARELFFHAATNTVLAWPRGGLDLLNDFKGSGFSILGGQDFGVFDLAGDGTGRLDLTWEVARYAVDPRVHPSQQTVRCFGLAGGLRCGFFEHFGNGSDAARWRRLELTRATADFDRDGLVGAQEALAGTSDFSADSDGDGASDGEEVELARTDPRDAGTGGTTPARLLGYGYSTLLQERFPSRTVDLNPLESRVLCGEGRCVDRAGRVVFTSDAGAALFASPAGTTFAFKTPAGLFVQPLDGGATRLATATEFSAQVGSSATRFAVTDDGRVFPLGGSRPVVFDGPQLRALWEPATACAPAFNECPDGGRPFDAVVGARVLAFDPQRERLLVTLVSALDARVVAVPLDGGAVAVLRRGAELPATLVQETIGGLVSTYHSSAPWLALSQVGEGFFGEYGLGAGLATGSAASRPLDRGALEWPHGSGWAGAAVTNDPIDTNALDGVNELAPTPLALEPGDVVALWGGVGHLESPDAVRVSFAKLGRRGGLVRLGHGLEGVAAPRTFARAPNGSLCVVAKRQPTGALELLEFLDPGADGVPTRQLRHAVSGVVACAYDAASTLHYLAEGPARLGRLVGGAVDKELPLPALSRPLHLVPQPLGGWYVASDVPLRCVDENLETVTASTLALLALAPSKTGAWWGLGAGTGALLRLNPEGLCSERVGVEATGVTLAALESARLGGTFGVLAAEVLERPDGRVVLQGTAWSGMTTLRPLFLPYFFNPETRRSGLLSADDLSPGLARVGGGDWCDPWGEGLDASAQACLSLEQAPPERPQAMPPDASVPLDGGSEPPPPTQGCGCQAGATVNLLVGLLLLARRRGARASRPV